MKKLVALLLCLALLAALPAFGLADEDVTLVFTYKQSASDDPLERWINDKGVVAAFEEAHPGVKIELRPIASTEGDYATLLALQLSSEKTAPDIFMEDTYMTATDAAAGYLACLDDYLAAWDEYDHYVPGAKAAVLGSDGKSYGVPISTDSRGIWYSLPVFEAVGIPTPWQPKSWEDVLDAARAIRKYNDDNGKNIQPLHITVGAINGEAVSMQTFEMLLYGTKDAMYKDGKWLVAGKGLDDTFGFIDTVYKENLGVSLDIALSADGLPTVVAYMFPNALVGMSMNVSTLIGYWLPGAAAPIDNIKEKIGFAAMPTQFGDPATVTICGGWSWAISSYCEHKDLAFEFLAFCGNQENATNRSIYDGRMSPRDDSLSVGAYAGIPFIDDIYAYMDYAFVRPKDEAYAAVSAQIQTLVEELASGSLTPAQAAEQYRIRVTNVVGEENTFVAE